MILDVVYNHFGPDSLDLWQFDGWSENDKGGIYFYNDWRSETPWGDTRPDYGREEVRQYLRDNALMWIEEFRADGVAFNALWPRTGIATAAIRFALAGDEGMRACRTVEIMADAAYAIVNRPSREATGNFYIDEEVLRAEGVTDFSKYAPGAKGALAGDFFVPDEVFARTETKVTGLFS